MKHELDEILVLVARFPSLDLRFRLRLNKQLPQQML
jgi:hypothetical protein